MNKLLPVAGLALAVAVPSTATAGPQPDHGDKRAAKQECRTLRGRAKATREAFRTQYRSLAACVEGRAAEEERAARRNASKDCRSERDTLGGEAFGEKYGTNANRRNAFGKCVSRNSREHQDAPTTEG